MDRRNKIEHYLKVLETELKELEILYEQYFAGVEKREPCQKRESVAKKIRTLGGRRIVQTDLRFRSQSLATRFHSYAGYWDRILRLMDEGKFVRKDTAGAVAAPGAKSSRPEGEIDRLYRDLAAAHRESGGRGTLPDRVKFTALIEQQREKMRQKLGRDVEFRITTEDGKPKIKARVRK